MWMKKSLDYYLIVKKIIAKAINIAQSKDDTLRL